MTSPYANKDPSDWLEITEALIDQHPLYTDEIVEIVLESWSSIFSSSLGSAGFNIGKDIFPKPQIMGFFLHELIPLELAARYPEEWRGEIDASDKDVVNKKSDQFSIEIKTSSNPKHIFGNRSFAQVGGKGKKAKDGYYLAVNFEKFAEKENPKIRLIRFGWLDSTDWIGQKAATGQQSRLPKEVYDYKLIKIYEPS